MNYIKILTREMDMPCCIKDFGGISKEEYFAAIDEMADAALKDATTQTNPRVPKKEDVVAIYEALWDLHRDDERY